MKKFIFIMTALIMGMMSINAQTVEKSRFFDNWSVGLKGGAVTPLNHAAFWGDMRGVVGVEVRKDVTLVLGMGLEGEWSVNTSSWKRNIHSSTVFDHQLVGGFMTANMMNLFGGYNGKPRVFEVETVVGLGWLHRYMNGHGDTNSWYTKFGANFNVNLGAERAWYLSFKPAIVYDMNDGVHTNYNLNRAYLELMVGVTYRFKNSNGTHNFTLCDKVYTQAEWDALNNEINELRARANEVEVREVIVEKEVVKEVIIDNTTITNAVGFTLNSDVISETEYANLENVARWINEHPNVTVYVNGYADEDTGTTEYNQELATRRAEAVKNVLVDTFGIDTERLIVCGVGSVEQPYDINNWNRVVIFSVNE